VHSEEFDRARDESALLSQGKTLSNWGTTGTVTAPRSVDRRLCSFWRRWTLHNPNTAVSSDEIIKLVEVELLSMNDRNATEALHIREMVWIPFFRDVTPYHWVIVPDVPRQRGGILKRRERISQCRGVKSRKNKTSNSQERCI